MLSPFLYFKPENCRSSIRPYPLDVFPPIPQSRIAPSDSRKYQSSRTMSGGVGDVAMDVLVQLVDVDRAVAVFVGVPFEPLVEPVGEKRLLLFVPLLAGFAILRAGQGNDAVELGGIEGLAELLGATSMKKMWQGLPSMASKSSPWELLAMAAATVSRLTILPWGIATPSPIPVDPSFSLA